jgi:hypothetical protein
MLNGRWHVPFLSMILSTHSRFRVIEAESKNLCREIFLEPIQEDWIQEHWVERVRRLSMMRIMARRTKAATVLV